LPRIRRVLVGQRISPKKRLHATLAQDALHDGEADDRQSV